ncbi:hypothetical protein, partial [Gluconobacter frateurii]
NISNLLHKENLMTEQEKILKDYQEEFAKTTVDDFLPFEHNGKTYDHFEMRYPSYSELEAHPDIMSDNPNKARSATVKLAKLCVKNVEKKTDIDAFPSYAVLAMAAWVGKHIV